MSRRRRPLSLRARLLAGMTVVAAVLAAVSVVVTSTTRDRLMDQVDARLAAFAPVRILDRSPPPDAPPPAAEGVGDRPSDVYLGLIDPLGRLVTRFVPNLGDGAYSPPRIAPDHVPSSGSLYFTAEAEEGEVTYRALARRIGEVVEITAVPVDGVQETITRLFWVEVLGSVAILAALGLVSWWVLRLGIRPVKEMTEIAGRIAEGDLTVRVPEAGGGAESKALAEALNRMLARIATAMEDQASTEARLRRFVADASHDLRTPITTIRGYAELYRLGGLGDPEALHDAMRRTEEESERMTRLVDDMLALARLDAERPLVLGPLDLVALVRDAVSDARAIAPHREITLELRCDRAMVDGDEDRLRQALTNVINNALVHTDDDVPIEVILDRARDSITVEVVDRGEGMPPEVAGRVTERFFRADPARGRSRGGSGLGLSIVESVLRAHGGRVVVESGQGLGTKVVLELPASGDAQGETSNSAIDAPQSGPSG